MAKRFALFLPIPDMYSAFYQAARQDRSFSSFSEVLPVQEEAIPYSARSWIAEDVWQEDQLIVPGHTAAALPVADDTYFSWRTADLQFSFTSPEKEVKRSQFRAYLMNNLNLLPEEGVADAVTSLSKRDVQVDEGSDSLLDQDCFAVVFLRDGCPSEISATFSEREEARRHAFAMMCEMNREVAIIPTSLAPDGRARWFLRAKGWYNSYRSTVSIFKNNPDAPVKGWYLFAS